MVVKSQKAGVKLSRSAVDAMSQKVPYNARTIVVTNSKQRGEHGYSLIRADNFVLIIIIEDNYSQLIQYEILEKLVTYIKPV